MARRKAFLAYGSSASRNSDLVELARLTRGSRVVETEKVQGFTQLKRPKATDLEWVFRRYPPVFRGVTIRQSEVWSRGFNVVHEDAEIVKIVEDMFQKINFQGKAFVSGVNADVFGNGYLEIVDDGEDVVGLSIVNPVFFDFESDANGVVKLDALGDPVGYMQKSTPDDSFVSAGGVKVPKEKVIHFVFNKLGDSPRGISLLEPILASASRAMNVEEGVAQAIFRHGFPQFDIEVGDSDHEPTKADVDSIVGQVKDLQVDNEYVHPFYHKVKVLESNSSRSFGEFSKIFLTQVVAGLGVPEPIVLGTGEGSNKATATVQSKHFRSQIEMIQNAIKFEVERKLFARLAELKGWEILPRLEWNQVLPEDEVLLVGQAATLFEKGIISKSEAREMLNLPAVPFAEDVVQPMVPGEVSSQPVSPSGEEKRGAIKVENPAKKVDKNVVKLPIKLPPAKGRDAFMSLSDEFEGVLNEFFDFLRNEALNKMVDLKASVRDNSGGSVTLSDESLNLFGSLKENAGELEHTLFSYSRAAARFGLQQALVEAGESEVVASASFLSSVDSDLLRSNSRVLSNKLVDEAVGRVRKVSSSHLGLLNTDFNVVQESLSSEFASLGCVSCSRKSGKSRSRLIVLSELSRGYNVGLLRGFAKKGVGKVQVDLSDCKNCASCGESKGRVFELRDAVGKFPSHPGCSCFWSIVK